VMASSRLLFNVGFRCTCPIVSLAAIPLDFWRFGRLNRSGVVTG
jgi:hypothetical protein